MWQSAAPLVGKPKVGKLSRGLVGRVHSNIPPPPHGGLVHGGDVPPLHGRSEASSSAAASAPPFPHPRPCPRRHSPRPSRGGVVHGGGLPPPRGYTRLLRGLLRCGRPARTPHRPTIPSAFSSENPARRILARTYCTSTSKYQDAGLYHRDSGFRSTPDASLLRRNPPCRIFRRGRKEPAGDASCAARTGF